MAFSSHPSAADSPPLSGVDEPFGLDGAQPNAAQAQPDEPVEALGAGDTIGDVTILGPLAEGGMGTVYEARERTTGRRVAVKLIRGPAPGPDTLGRFFREARLLAQLRHQHVAALHAFGEHRGPTGSVPYLVLELVDRGRSITQYAADEGLGIRLRVGLVRDACLGVAHAHDRGVVHRDLKPGNILVDATGSVRVIDFGVARSLGDGDASFATAAGEIVGTLAYMAPEQVLGRAGEVDARSDVYALGLVIHELVAGRLPYDLREAGYLEAARVAGDPAAPGAQAVASSAERECGRDQARAISHVVAACLEKSPLDRYASAGLLAADLDRWLAGEPVQARPPTLGESLRRLARRHRSAVAAACAAAALLVAALVAISGLSLAERRQRRDAEAHRAVADRARAEAERQADAARERLYVSSVLLAAEARDRDNVAEAARLLDAARDLARPGVRGPHGPAAPSPALEIECLAATLDESSGSLVRMAGGVAAVACRPAAGQRAIAGIDGGLWLWPGRIAARPGDPAWIPGGHEGRIWRLAISPDGRLLASTGADGRVIVRRLPDAQVVATLQPHAGAVYGCGFSPAHALLATAGRDGVVRIWDTNTWQEERTLTGHEGTVYAVAFAPDGSRLATAGSDRTARLWSADSGAPIALLAGHAGRVFDVAFSPDGHQIATASEDGTARLWNLAGATEAARLRHPFRVNAVAFSDTGLDLATASGDGVLRVWDPTSGVVRRLRGHVDDLWAVAADGPGQLVTGSGDGTARRWRIDGRDAPVRPAGARVLSTAYSADGRLLAAGLADGSVAVWDAASLASRGRLGGGSGRVNGIGFSPDAARLVGGCDDGSVVIWSRAAAAAQARFHPHARRVYSAAFAADGLRILTASEDGTALCLDATTGAPLLPPLRHGRRVFCAAFSPDERLIATASEDRTARLWDARTGAELARLEGHEGPVNWAAFSPDGRRLVTASSDSTLRVWNLADASASRIPSLVLSGANRQVWKGVFSPTGDRIVGATADGAIFLWDAANGQTTYVIRAESHPGDAAAPDPAGREAARASLGRGHWDQVWGVACAPDGPRFATGSWDGTVRIWGLSAAAVAGAAAAAAVPEPASWNQFRGPEGTGHTEATLPLEWSEARHVRWKTPIPGKAWASPVEADGRIWLANATEDGTRLSAVCVAAATGAVLHDITLFEPAEPMYCHPYNSHASPTPVIAGGRVFLHFGSAGTACLDAADGRVLWRRTDLPCDHHRGPGSSPIPVDDLLVVNFDGFDLQYVVALDQATGETVWKTDRSIDYGSDNGDLKKAYCTPTLIGPPHARQLVSPAAAGTVAYDPRSGAELWKVQHGGFNAAARPLFAGGLVVIVVEGGDRVLAVRPGGEGDVTRSHVAWKFGKSTPTRPSPCAVGDHLYMVSDRGIFTCLDLATGDARWQERREGRHSAALLESAGRLYACDEDGTTVVVAADPAGFRILAENRLDDGCMASPCVVGNDLVVRTKTHLYRIGE